MGMIDKIAGVAVATKLENYAAGHPVARDYPAQDLQKLQEIAGKVAADLPRLAADLDKLLPKKLPTDATDAPDVRNAAIKLGEHLLAVVPPRFTSQLDAARDRASSRTQDPDAVYAKLRRGVGAAPYFAQAIPAALVSFCTDNGVTPTELQTLKTQLDKIAAMLPLVEAAGPDLVTKLRKLEELTGLAALANTANAGD